ncbi:hypothetical protein [Halobacillus salinus]|uniref:hypothetical protein n=1 Tax=Halobacillus salinus TaxID=192814 RepID=UPI0009A7F8A1|nr:hypothetical protein [Halobacillus salinus]
MNNRFIILSAMIVCFAAFSAGVWFADRSSLFVLIGILGMSGFGVLVYKVVSGLVEDGSDG